MAVTDRSSSIGMQPRVWAVTVGNATLGLNILVRKTADVYNGWASTNVNGLTSVGLAAVAWTDSNPTNHRERVFYTKNGKLNMLPYNNGSQGTVVQVTPTANYTLADSDVAAVTWLDGTTRRIAVLAGAKLSGTPGYTCYFEYQNGTWLTPACSASTQITSLNPDIVGVKVSSTVGFYFRNTTGGLSRIRRIGAGAVSGLDNMVEPNAETIYPSLFAIESQVSGLVELGVMTGTTNSIYTGRVSHTGTSPTWTLQPALPNGDVPFATTSAIGAVKYTGTPGPYTRMNVFVVANFNLYFTGTDDAGTWSLSWSGPFRPGGGQVVWGIGDVTEMEAEFLRLPRAFLAGGGSSSTVLQEFSFNGITPVFRDHIRKQLEPEALGPNATEAAGAMGAQSGIFSAVKRTLGPPYQPWYNLVDDTTDGANSFAGTDLAVNRMTVGNSSSDAVVDVGGGAFHYVDIEYPNNTDCQPTGGTDRVVFRTGPSANYIRLLDTVGEVGLFVLESSTGSLNFDHPWTVVTEDVFGQATAHVAYWRASSGVKYWKRLPEETNPPPPTVLSLLPPSTPLLLRGANQSVYAVSFNPEATGTFAGWPSICQLPSCTTVATVGDGQQPHPTSKNIAFGPQQGSTQGKCCFITSTGQDCPLDSNQQCPATCPGSGLPTTTLYKCFDVHQPVALWASPTVERKIYAAYTAPDATGGETSIYFTRSDAIGGTFGDWSTPIRIHSHPASDNNYYIDPEVSIDDEGTIIVTYSSITQSLPAPGDTTGVATSYVAFSTDDGVTWFNNLLGSWDADGLPYYCRRKKHFLGEYRQPSVVGGRAIHPVQKGTTSHYQHARWFSRWQIVN